MLQGGRVVDTVLSSWSEIRSNSSLTVPCRPFHRPETSHIGGHAQVPGSIPDAPRRRVERIPSTEWSDCDLCALSDQRTSEGRAAWAGHTNHGHSPRLSSALRRFRARDLAHLFRGCQRTPTAQAGRLSRRHKENRGSGALDRSLSRTGCPRVWVQTSAVRSRSTFDEGRRASTVASR